MHYHDAMLQRIRLKRRERQTRRTRRLIPHFIAALAVLALAAPAAAQQTVFVVRHAERADSTPGAKPTMATDPDLSEAGRARAASLATALKDAGIVAIFTTEFKRTQQTAEPLAKALGLTVKVVKGDAEASLVEQVAAAKGNVLVVGHSNTVPSIVKRLGVTTAVAVGDDEFDNLFIVTRGGAPSLLHLHYR
jgi:broad specificity phosphatase PhoE